jgi:hypothetical protein
MVRALVPRKLALNVYRPFEAEDEQEFLRYLGAGALGEFYG